MKKNKRGILAMWLLLLLQVFPSVTISYSEKQLTQKQAEELLLNVPDAVAVKAKRGCPSVYPSLAERKAGKPRLFDAQSLRQERSGKRFNGNFHSRPEKRRNLEWGGPK